MKLKTLLCILCAALMLTGCAHASLLSQETKEDTWADSGFITVGHNLTIQNTDNRFRCPLHTMIAGIPENTLQVLESF